MTGTLDIVLNAEQRMAVEYGAQDEYGNFIAGPLLILAGAGTGKTNTLAHRAAHLIVNDVAPENILLMTFSRRAANELVDRTRRIVALQLKNSKIANNSAKGARLQIPWMGTFHSIANRLLRHYSRSIGLQDNFTIIDRGDAEDTLDILRHELGLSSLAKRFPKKSTCLNIYSRCVNSQQPLESILQKDFPWCQDWAAQLKQLFALYTERKIQQQSLDYDDLLLYWYHLSGTPQIALELRNRFHHILIDEYQDTNILQAGIVKRLFHDGKGVTVVGDDAQSIYSFRSAEIENILHFPQQYQPASKVITLKQNYRSIQPILDVSNQLLKESKIGYQKTLYSLKKGTDKVKLVTVEDAINQAKYIVECVLSAREAGTSLRQQAVLFRNAYHSDQLEIELFRHDIPFVKYGGLKFLEASHVKDLLAIIRWMDNPKHHASGFRVLKMLPGFGPSSASKALDFLALNDFNFMQFSHFSPPQPTNAYWQELCQLLQNSHASINGQRTSWPAEMELAKTFYHPLLEDNYDDAAVRFGDIEQLVNVAQQYQSRQSFISELTLDPPIATGDLNQDASKDDDFLILSTVHSAKGQEWKNVFILNVADGNFPSEYATNDIKTLEEERRLLHVAMTRAKQNLHLMQPLKYWVPEQPKYGDKHVYGAKSRFLSDKILTQLETIYWPRALAQVAEPAANYGVLNDIQSKLRSLW
jgi:DNA helicase II / ATP-dependent DNA helicase PcrA